MLPVLALVGRPNVGKSTLFNRLTRSRDALVGDQPGVTRDRLYGRGRLGDAGFLAVDTGGLSADEDAFGPLIRQQVELAVEEAQAILFIVDAAHGLAPQDREIGALLRRNKAAVFVVVNKSEAIEDEVASAEFQALGLGAPHAISALRGSGVDELLSSVLAALTQWPAGETETELGLPKITLAGRPNVGKSTLANRLAGQARALVSPIPGTTRDSVRMALNIGEQRVMLIDTAGVRRKSRVHEVIEKFSVIKTLQAMEEAQVVLLILDASAEISTQDAAIAGMIQDLGRSLVVVVNKWDCLAKRQRQKIQDEIDRKLPFLPNPETVFISALRGSNLAAVMPAAMRAHRSAMLSIATSSINRTLADAVAQTPPPARNGRPTRLKFAHQAGKNPPLIVVHGGQAEKLPESYRRYLARYFARAYRLVGTPVRIIARTAVNPYAGRTARARSSKAAKTQP